MILLISDTPVAGTVNRIAYWLNKLAGQSCHALVSTNYPHNAFRLNQGAFAGLPQWEKIIVQCIHQANSIFIHNIVNIKLLNLIFAIKPEQTLIYYQIHSPPLEYPLLDYKILSMYPFNKILAVAQGHGRFIDDSLVVPNIIADFSIPYTIEKSPLIFSPHMRSTQFRWSKKFSETDKKELLAYQKQMGEYQISNDIATVFGREVITHEEMLLYLQAISIIIDDINTGLFHQTALEALKASCAVFSAADLASIEQFCIAADAETPPFIFVNGIDDVINLLVDSLFRKTIPKIMKNSKRYAEHYLAEQRLAECYFKQIKELV